MAMNAMEKVMELLEEIIPDADFRENTALVDEGILTSFELVQLVTRIGEEFDVSILPEQIIPENFNSAESICRLIQERKEDN